MEANEGNKGRFDAGAGTLALGVIGTALGGLNTLAGGSGLPGFGGGSNAALAEAQTKIAKLEAERYADEKIVPLDEQSVRTAAEFAAFRKEVAMQAEIDRQNAKINLLETVGPIKAELGEQRIMLNGLRDVVGGITKIGVPNTAIIGGSAARA